MYKKPSKYGWNIWQTNGWNHCFYFHV